MMIKFEIEEHVAPLAKVLAHSLTTLSFKASNLLDTLWPGAHVAHHRATEQGVALVAYSLRSG